MGHDPVSDGSLTGLGFLELSPTVLPDFRGRSTTGRELLAVERSWNQISRMGLIIALVAIGILLMLLEFVLPGGIAGLIGLGCLGVGIVLTYARFGPAAGNLLLVGVFCLLTIGTILWFRYFPHSPAGQLFVSKGESGNPGYEFTTLADKTGKTLSDLRPSGTAQIEGRRYDVVAEGSFVAKDTEVRVIEVEGNRIVVRPCQPS